MLKSATSYCSKSLTIKIEWYVYDNHQLKRKTSTDRCHRDAVSQGAGGKAVRPKCQEVPASPYLSLRAGGLPAGLAAVDEPRGLVDGGRHVQAVHHPGPAVQQRPWLTAVTTLQLFSRTTTKYCRLPYVMVVKRVKMVGPNLHNQENTNFTTERTVRDILGRHKIFTKSHMVSQMIISKLQKMSNINQGTYSECNAETSKKSTQTMLMFQNF